MGGLKIFFSFESHSCSVLVRNKFEKSRSKIRGEPEIRQLLTGYTEENI